MMQNVTQDEDHDSNKEIRTVEIEQGNQTGPYPSPLPLDKTPPLPTSQSTFGQDVSTSDDDEISDVSMNYQHVWNKSAFVTTEIMVFRSHLASLEHVTIDFSLVLPFAYYLGNLKLQYVIEQLHCLLCIIMWL